MLDVVIQDGTKVKDAALHREVSTTPSITLLAFAFGAVAHLK